MPIYEYICTVCGYEYDALQKLSEAPLIDCPACQQPAFKKQVSAPGFRLGGTGWYETDFKSDKQRNLVDPGTQKETDKQPSQAADKATDKPAAKETPKQKETAA